MDASASIFGLLLLTAIQLFVSGDTNLPDGGPPYPLNVVGRNAGKAWECFYCDSDNNQTDACPISEYTPPSNSVYRNNPNDPGQRCDVCEKTVYMSDAGDVTRVTRACAQVSTNTSACYFGLGSLSTEYSANCTGNANCTTMTYCCNVMLCNAGVTITTGVTLATSILCVMATYVLKSVTVGRVA